MAEHLHAAGEPLLQAMVVMLLCLSVGVDYQFALHIWRPLTAILCIVFCDCPLICFTCGKCLRADALVFANDGEELRDSAGTRDVVTIDPSMKSL